jgi:hypothetical protein
MRTSLLEYHDILSTIQSVDKFAHIAGGAVRDTVLNRPFRDVDFFLHAEHCDAAAQLIRNQHQYVMTGRWVQYEGFSDPAVCQVAKFEKWDETMPVCLIGLVDEVTNIKQNLGRFDFGVCMAAWDGGDRFYQRDAFHKDVENKYFTMLRADNLPQFRYSMSRYRKLTDAQTGRYAGWSIAIPVEFEHFVEAETMREHWYHDYDDRAEHGFFDGDQLLRPKER